MPVGRLSHRRGMRELDSCKSLERGDLRSRVGAKFAHVEREGTVVTRCGPYRLNARGDIDFGASVAAGSEERYRALNKEICFL
eukprot:2944478-Pleurochrysis_carterae.AAC.2